MPKGEAGGPLPHTIDLSEQAARHLRHRALVTGPRFTRAQASATANAILEADADHRLILVTDEMLAAVDWLTEAKRLCWSEDGQRGLDQLIAALLTATETTRAQ